MLVPKHKEGRNNGKYSQASFSSLQGHAQSRAPALPRLSPPIPCVPAATILPKTLRKNLVLSLLRLKSYTSPKPEGLIQLYLLRKASSLLRRDLREDYHSRLISTKLILVCKTRAVRISAWGREGETETPKGKAELGFSLREPSAHPSRSSEVGTILRADLVHKRAGSSSSAIR